MAALAAQWQHELMPWQRQVLDVALEVHPDTGQLAYRLVILTVPRQSGKSSLILPLWLHRCVAWGVAQRAVYAAQHRNAARAKFLEDWKPLLQTAPGVKDLGKILAGKGDEKMEFKNGSYFELSASTEVAGHGLTVDLGIIDEAFSQPDARLEQAMRPAMITRDSPQLWVVSTKGTDTAIYLNEKLALGRRAVEDDLREGVAFFEWSAEPDADPGDPATWRACMPALGITASEESVRADFLSMELPEFRRAYLNVWTPGAARPPVAPEAWAACGDASCTPAGRLAFGVAISEDRATGAVYVADEEQRMELVHHAGTPAEVEALPGWLVERVRKHRVERVWLDPSTQAGSLLAELDEAGVVTGTAAGREMGQACAEFRGEVLAGRVQHLPSGLTATALASAGRRKSGELWTWTTTSAKVDVTPVVAATLALHGVRQPPPKTTGPVFAY